MVLNLALASKVRGHPAKFSLSWRIYKIVLQSARSEKVNAREEWKVL